MPWVATIKEHRDYFKNHHTEETAFFAETEEDAKKLAVIYVMEKLDEDDYRPFVETSIFPEVTDKLKKAMLSRDPNILYKLFSTYADDIFPGEYVDQLLEVEVYKQREDIDKVDEDKFRELCDSARGWVDEDGELVPRTEDEMERLYDEDGDWAG
jgi:hypothetical protein